MWFKINSKISLLSCETFLDYSFYLQIFLQDYEYHFSGSRHTKGPFDVEGAVLKTQLNSWIAHDGTLTQSVEDFVNVYHKISSPKWNANKKSKPLGAVFGIVLEV